MVGLRFILMCIEMSWHVWLFLALWWACVHNFEHVHVRVERAPEAHRQQFSEARSCSEAGRCTSLPLTPARELKIGKNQKHSSWDGEEPCTLKVCKSHLRMQWSACDKSLEEWREKGGQHLIGWCSWQGFWPPQTAQIFGQSIQPSYKWTMNWSSNIAICLPISHWNSQAVVPSTTLQTCKVTTQKNACLFVAAKSKSAVTCHWSDPLQTEIHEW